MSTSKTINGNVRQLKRYPSYRESQVEWIGTIPAHWDKEPLKYVTRFVNGAPFKPQDWGDEGTPIIRIENLNGGRTFNYTTLEVEPRYLVRKGDLLFAWSGNRGTSFGPFLWREEGEYFLNQHIFRVEGFRLQKSWFYWLLKGVTAYVESQAHGIIGLVHITKQDLGAIRVPVIPPDEQVQIGAFLDRETTKIDALIAKKERLIELLHEKRTALIAQAVTKGLDPTVPMKDSGVEWVQQVPAHWAVLRNGFLFFDRDQRGYPDLPILEVSIHTGVKVREFSGEHVEQKAEDPSTYKRSLKGDLAFNKMRMWQGAVGVTPVDGLVSPDYQVCRPRHGVHSRYFEQLFRTSFYMTEINRFSHGIVRDRNRLYWDQFKEMPSLVPPPDEQLRIIEHIDEMTERTRKMTQRVKDGIDKLREYRIALISAAVTGKIDVREEVA